MNGDIVCDWQCGSCRAPLGNEFCEQLPNRLPCPHCGAMTRQANVAISESVQVREYLKMHSKHREGGQKVLREEISGDDLHRKTGKWNLLRRIIDRKNDRYEEHIVSGETGETIRHVEEPLREHRNLKKR